MQRLIGNNVCVHLKNEPDLNIFMGLLVDMTDESLYLQIDDKLNIIPKCNVRYCTTDVMPSESRALESYPQQSTTPELNIYIDSELFITIPVLPTFDLDTWHNGIMALAMEKREVSDYLTGKIQEKVEYSPGVLNIITKQVATEYDISNGQNSFSMFNGPVSKFVNPVEMVARLKNAGKPGE